MAEKNGDLKSEIRLYTSSNCPNCKVFKSVLLALKVDFIEIKANNQKVIEEIVKISGMKRVPLLVTPKGYLNEYDLEKIKSLI